MIVPHPIPYQGSKRNLAQAIISYFPKDTTRLIEPFAGSAAISLAAAGYRKSSEFLINDINEPLMALWQQIIEHPDALAEAYKILWQAQIGKERQFYDEVRTIFNQTHRADCLLYLLARCVKAAVRYNANGEFNQSPDNRRLGSRPENMRMQLLGASRLLKKKTQISSVDYRYVLNGATEADIVYMDPPYQGVCGSRDQRYKESIENDDFVEALRCLNQRNVPYIVSYDGRTGKRSYGYTLPTALNLFHIELCAGRSTQATLLGRQDETFESLYLSPALVEKLGEVKKMEVKASTLALEVCV